MLFLNEHRKAAVEDQEVLPIKPPFSFFDFAEDRFDGCDSIRRIFSLARSSGAESVIIEQISPVGIIKEENEDLTTLFSDYVSGGLYRLSFWLKSLPPEEIRHCENKDLVGYAILKQDLVPSKHFNEWHVFEAVFHKYPHHNNCLPNPQKYSITVDKFPFEIQGLLYCQQNTLNKACAQVALRSVLSRVLPEGDISYRQINEIADTVSPGFNPGDGLQVPQMRKIFEVLNLKFSDVDYTTDPQLRETLPYQKYTYAGLESGAGALLGFHLAGAGKHIIPIYGHTFNKDTWVPDANISYFQIGTGIGYIPSETWMSSFIGHDDNFGPNFCIPRLYIDNSNVDYVVEFFKPGVLYSGVQAEAVALNIIYSILPSLNGSKNKWILRLMECVSSQKIVFRAQALTKGEYISHLRGLKDWNGQEEKPEICEVLNQELPEFVWAVEISTPQLFSANQRKFGEIVLDATKRLNTANPCLGDDVFTFARVPGLYLLGGHVDKGLPQFSQVPSDIITHTALMTL